MKTPVDTQALVWLRALKKKLREVNRNLDFCIHGQESRRLSQEQFDQFRKQIAHLAKKIIVSIEGDYPK